MYTRYRKINFFTTSALCKYYVNAFFGLRALIITKNYYFDVKSF